MKPHSDAQLGNVIYGAETLRRQRGSEKPATPAKRVTDGEIADALYGIHGQQSLEVKKKSLQPIFADRMNKFQDHYDLTDEERSRVEDAITKLAYEQTNGSEDNMRRFADRLLYRAVQPPATPEEVRQEVAGTLRTIRDMPIYGKDTDRLAQKVADSLSAAIEEDPTLRATVIGSGVARDPEILPLLFEKARTGG